MRFSGLAVFVLFFGLALVEALQEQKWLQAGLFLALGLLFLWVDLKGRQQKPQA